jgi:hypothetical protein
VGESVPTRFVHRCAQTPGKVGGVVTFDWEQEYYIHKTVAKVYVCKGVCVCVNVFFDHWAGKYAFERERNLLAQLIFRFVVFGGCDALLWLLAPPNPLIPPVLNIFPIPNHPTASPLTHTRDSAAPGRASGRVFLNKTSLASFHVSSSRPDRPPVAVLLFWARWQQQT